MGLLVNLLSGNMSAVLLGTVALIVFLTTIGMIPWRCPVKTQTTAAPFARRRGPM